MSRYLLATYRVQDDAPGTPTTPREMQELMERIIALEAEMDEAGAFVFGGALDGPHTAAVAHVGKTMLTDGPFAESKEQIAGFYIVEAASDDDAGRWAAKVADATNHPIELRRFAASGRAKDMVGPTGGH